jgi:nucleotide-binding universal stress UspA family protein
MLSIKTILHPTDFSPRAEYGYQMACALARDYGAHLILAHIKPLPAVVYGEFGAIPPAPEETLEGLKTRLTEFKPPNLTVEYHVVEGEPAAEIVRFAVERKADMIVLGTHGRTGIGRFLLGSVAEQVMRKAPCPVLTVKMPVAEKEPATAPAKEFASV